MTTQPQPPGHPHQPTPAVPTTPHSAEEYPQAIAEDYPGWAVRHHDSQWTAWCPARTVHATTPAQLRAAIEDAITGGTPP